MNKSDDWHSLIGQLTADALVRDALLISLMEVIPDLHARLEAKVVATAHVMENQLPATQRATFRDRIFQVRQLLDDAYPSADDAME